MSWDLIGIGLVVGAIVTGYLAYKGKLSWGWVVGIAATALAVFSRRRKSSTTFHPPPPTPPLREVVAPVVEAAIETLEDDRERIRDAESEEDRLLRLQRLSETNDGGRQ